MLSATQNNQILNALQKGTMQFLRMGSSGDPPSQAEPIHFPNPTGLEEIVSHVDGYAEYDGSQ